MTPLPCPFCGAPPVVGEHRSSDETGECEGYAYAECPNHGATHFAGVHADSIDEAVAVWNARAAPATEPRRADAAQPCKCPSVRDCYLTEGVALPRGYRCSRADAAPADRCAGWYATWRPCGLRAGHSGKCHSA